MMGWVDLQIDHRSAFGSNFHKVHLCYLPAKPTRSLHVHQFSAKGEGLGMPGTRLHDHTLTVTCLFSIYNCLQSTAVPSQNVDYNLKHRGTMNVYMVLHNIRHP